MAAEAQFLSNGKEMERIAVEVGVDLDAGLDF